MSWNERIWQEKYAERSKTLLARLDAETDADTRNAIDREILAMMEDFRADSKKAERE